MRRTLLAFLTVSGLTFMLASACRKGDGTTPSPSGPIQPSAGPAIKPTK